jgi:hypothetical protein
MNYSSDIIGDLPTDETVLTHSEIEIFDKLFKNENDVKKILNELQDTILVGILFGIFSLEILNNIIYKYIPVTKKSIYLLIFVKSLMVMVLYYFLKNMYLIKNK